MAVSTLKGDHRSQFPSSRLTVRPVKRGGKLSIVYQVSLPRAATVAGAVNSHVRWYPQLGQNCTCELELVSYLDQRVAPNPYSLHVRIAAGIVLRVPYCLDNRMR